MIRTRQGQDITALGESVNQIDAMVDTMKQTLEAMCGLVGQQQCDEDAAIGQAAGECDSAV